MKKYRVAYSDDAEHDFEELYQCIAIDYGSPVTAFRYLTGLRQQIESLEVNPYMCAIRSNHSLLKYGFDVRRLNYKKMAIIYTVHDDVVFIHRIIAGNMITGL